MIWYGAALLAGYLVGAQLTLWLLRHSEGYRSHCGLRKVD